MKHCPVGAFICAFVLLAACAPSVPEDARLLYYGEVTDPQQITDVLPMDEIADSPRQVYISDDSKVIAVRTLDAKHHDLNLNISWQPGHKYRVYIY